MPTNKELRKQIAELTCQSFADDAVITKTNYKQSEANQLILRSLITYHGLCIIDEIMVNVLKGTPTMATSTVLDIMRNAWNSGYSLRTKQQHRIICSIHAKLTSSSIGRNQLIDIILNSTKEHTNG